LLNEPKICMNKEKASSKCKGLIKRSFNFNKFSIDFNGVWIYFLWEGKRVEGHEHETSQLLFYT